MNWSARKSVVPSRIRESRRADYATGFESLPANSRTAYEWINPAVHNLVYVTTSEGRSFPYGRLEDVLSRDTTPLNCHTSDCKKGWIAIDFGWYFSVVFVGDVKLWKARSYFDWKPRGWRRGLENVAFGWSLQAENHTLSDLSILVLFVLVFKTPKLAISDISIPNIIARSPVVTLGMWIIPSAYTLRHSRGYEKSALRNWLFQASKDGQTWVTLHNHSNDTSLNEPGWVSPICCAGILFTRSKPYAWYDVSHEIVLVIYNWCSLWRCREARGAYPYQSQQILTHFECDSAISSKPQRNYWLGNLSQVESSHSESVTWNQSWLR